MKTMKGFVGNDYKTVVLKTDLALNQPGELVIRFPGFTWFLFHMASIFFLALVFSLLGLKTGLWRL